MIDWRALPTTVTIREEGPRDGWQNIADVVIPTSRKVELIHRLAAAGFPRITVTSMVHPRWVPQLADADDVLAALRPYPGIDFGVLVPNRVGWSRLRRHLDDGVPVSEVVVVASVSEAHNRSNLNQAVAETLAEVEPVVTEARERGLHVCGGMATVFGCSIAGRVPLPDVIGVASSLVQMGVTELTLGDTTGMANPRQVADVLGELSALLPGVRLTPHFHNTRGLGLANVLSALTVGIDSFEAAYGELGGCQFAPGATGNIATEDLLHLLDELGITHGVDVDAVIDVARDTERFLGRRLDGHVMHAGRIDWKEKRT